MSGVYRKWDSSYNWRNPVERTWKTKAKDEAGELGKSKRVVPGASKGQVWVGVARCGRLCFGSATGVLGLLTGLLSATGVAVCGRRLVCGRLCLASAAGASVGDRRRRCRRYRAAGCEDG